MTDTPDKSICKPIAEPTYDGDWLVQHAKHIGSSDAAAICGMSPHSQAFDVWAEKTGKTDGQEQTDYMRRGKAFEPVIAGEYALTVDDRMVHPCPMFESLEWSWLASTPDAMVPQEKKIVEIKLAHWTQAIKLGEEGSDQVFPEWVIQVHLQMIVTGCREADVFVCVSPHDYRLYHVEFSQVLADRLIERLTAFWELVQSDTPPDINFDHRSAKAILARVEITGESVQLISPDLVESVATYKRYGQRIAKLTKVREIHRLRLMAAMGTAATCELLGADGKPMHVLKRSQVKATKIAFDKPAYKKFSISKPKGKRSG